MADQPDKPKTSIRETLTSITIAFAVAFVFRAFIIEAFVIPTGSMAPTLMGAHMRLHSDQTGYTWPVGPRHYESSPVMPGAPGKPLPIQGTPDVDVSARQVAQPMTGGQFATTYYNEVTRAGDRILVLKYLFGVFDPERFDVVVFKSPVEPQKNFIKRLVGLPGEQVSFVDGDVFVRDASGPLADGDVDGWSTPGWTVARKSERVQRAVWQDVFDSSFTPIREVIDGKRIFRSPWEGAGWQVADSRAYTYDGASGASLQWDSERWPIRDYYPYDDTLNAPSPTIRITRNDIFPVADLALSAGVRPERDGVAIAAVVEGRGHEFRGRIEGARVELAMRNVSAGESEWTTLETVTLDEPPLEPGKVTNIEFWHVDQSLQMYVEGNLVARHDYEWNIAERVRNATGAPIETHLARPASGRLANVFMEPGIYRSSSARWDVEGGPVTLHRVTLERDLYYQPNQYQPQSRSSREINPRAGQPALGTHPSQVATLDPDQFMVCGDNSPASSDSRLWSANDPWVELIDESQGLVPRELLIGRAFFVYFPAPIWRGKLPIPDFGRLRFIW